MTGQEITNVCEAVREFLREGGEKSFGEICSHIAESLPEYKTREKYQSLHNMIRTMVKRGDLFKMENGNFAINPGYVVKKRAWVPKGRKSVPVSHQSNPDPEVSAKKFFELGVIGLLTAKSNGCAYTEIVQTLVEVIGDLVKGGDITLSAQGFCVRGGQQLPIPSSSGARPASLPPPGKVRLLPDEYKMYVVMQKEGGAASMEVLMTKTGAEGVLPGRVSTALTNLCKSGVFQWSEAVKKYLLVDGVVVEEIVQEKKTIESKPLPEMVFTGLAEVVRRYFVENGGKVLFVKIQEALVASGHLDRRDALSTLSGVLRKTRWMGGPAFEYMGQETERGWWQLAGYAVPPVVPVEIKDPEPEPEPVPLPEIIPEKDPSLRKNELQFPPGDAGKRFRFICGLLAPEEKVETTFLELRDAMQAEGLVQGNKNMGNTLESFQRRKIFSSKVPGSGNYQIDRERLRPFLVALKE